MKILLTFFLCLPLSGCLFFYIPTGIFQSGNTCVSDAVRVGQKIGNRQTGKIGTVKELHGRSDRCQSAELPIVATVEYD